MAREIIENYYLIDNRIQSVLLELDEKDREIVKYKKEYQNKHNLTTQEFYESTASEVMRLRFMTIENEKARKHHIETNHKQDHNLIYKVFDELLEC